MADRADALVTREAGKRVRGELLALDAGLAVGERITIDLTGVDVLTPSFVDECLGRLVSQVGLAHFRDRFCVQGADADWQTLINSVVRNRLLLDRKGAVKPPVVPSA